MGQKKDRLYAERRESVEPFRFDASVADVFRDMIERSVPGYPLLLELIGLAAARYAISGTRCYDLGCSLGDSTLALASGVAAGRVRVIAVDNSPAMVAACGRNLANAGPGREVELRCEDVRDTSIENASVVVMNFTLQFIDPDERLPLLTKVATGILPGGVLLLSEKIVAETGVEQDAYTALHESFKREHGYSELEIAQKRNALEAVLIPDTLDLHLRRLRDAGFAASWVWFRCLHFVSILAQKRG